MDVRLAMPGLAGLQQQCLGDPRVRIAVLDGPVDTDHPCFLGARLRTLETLVHEEAGPGRMSRHGTHVASLLLAQPGTPVAGVAPHCTGLLAPVFQDYQEGRLPQLDLARAIERAVLEGAHVINISGGERSTTGEPDPILRRALQLCAENNVLVVAAAGNDGCECLHVPAAVPTVLAVGALGRDGLPLPASNWGEPYLRNGVTAPGELLTGARPGGGTTEMTGTSFSTPLVAGVAALLLSDQVRQGRDPDPTAVGEAILRTAIPCRSPDETLCRRHLVGVIDIQRAHAQLNQRGSKTMADPDESVGAGSNPTAVPRPDAPPSAPASAPPGGWGVSPQGDTRAGDAVDQTGPVDPPAVSPAGTAAAQPAPQYATAPPYGVPPWGVPPWGVVPQAAPGWGYPPPGPAPGTGAVTPSSEQPAGGPAAPGCGCKSRPAGPTHCDCVPTAASYVYALGTIGFDFGTEARRDTFRQLMPDVERQQEGEAPVFTAPNPYDVFQLVDYLGSRPSESTKLIWTLNLDLTPIYAVEAEVTYPEDVYATLRDALKAQSLPEDDAGFVSRVSIPGVLTNRTVQLYSGQVVPVVVAQPRGLYRWEQTRLVDAVVGSLRPTLRDDMDEEYVRRTIRAFLDKVYFECRNLGQSPGDRALNFAATNAYQFAAGIAEGFLSGHTLVPGAEAELYTLDSIDVTKSPYCRVDSDCWDVRITFFDPVNDRRAKSVYMFTIDVSDALPVTLSPAHRYLTT